MLSFYNTQVN